MRQEGEIFVYYWIVDDSEDTTKIRIYGINDEQQNVCLFVDDFTPFCYIQLPNDESGIAVERCIKKNVLSCELVFRKHLYNTFNAVDKDSPFLFCQCASKKNIYNIIYTVTKCGVFIPGHGTVKLNVHEQQASPVLQLLSIKNLPAAGWIKFQGEKLTSDQTTTSCDLEYRIRWKKLGKVEKLKQITPKCLSFDIEVNSNFMNQMPADRPGDAIFQISCVIDEFNQPQRKVLFTIAGKDIDIGTSKLLQDVHVHTMNSEEDILLGFIKFVTEERPNVLCGFNILGFDIEYIIKRCSRFFLMEELKSIGFNKECLAREEKIKWSSNAYQKQEFTFLNWEGILLLDLLPIIRRDYKLDTYSLKNVCSVFLKNNEKDPVTHKDIFRAYQTKTNLDVIGKYCVQDSNLCSELLKHLHCWVSLSEMAKVCNVSMFVLYTQGQQIKTYSQVYKYCFHEKIVVDTNGYESTKNEKYTGAYVFEPVPNVYDNVVPFDFSSLYPSIMISQNICYSTIVSNPNIPDDQCNIFEWEDHVGCKHDTHVIRSNMLTEEIDVLAEEIKKLYIVRDEKKGAEKKAIQEQINQLRISQRPMREKRQNIKKGTPVNRYDADGNLITGVICEKRYYRFYKSEVKKGVIPTIIQNLLVSRARVRKLIKDAPPDVALIYDKEQNAYKISANSMYGAMGVKRGYLPLMPGAMCVTYFGRRSLELAAKEIVSSKHKGQLIYGDTDSCYVIFPHLKITQEIWDHAINTADSISSLFPAPMKLEFEQTIYKRFLILSKKRYIFQAVGRDGVPNSKIGKKGVVLSRRDNSKFVRDLYEKISMMIFTNKNYTDIIDCILETINNLYRNCLPYEMYVITKSIGDSGDEEGKLDNNRLGDYKVKNLPEDDELRNKILNGRTEKEYYITQCPAHVQLGERMRKRGCPVMASSRLEFLVIKKTGLGKHPLLSERIEDFEYFKTRSDILRIDPEYYLSSIINPIDQLLEIGIKNNHFVKDQYTIRSQYDKVVNEIKRYGRPILKCK